MHTPPNTATTLNDRDALARFVANADPEAFEVLTARYQGMVLATCARILRSPADAEDAAQETFLKLARHASQIRSNLGAWLHAAAMGSAVDLVRRAGAVRRSERRAARPEAADTPSPADSILWGELEPVLDEALGALDPDDRDLLVSRYLCARPQRDLAHELGVSKGTVSRRMDRALSRLNAQLRSRGIGSASTGALVAAMGAIPAVSVPAALTSSVLKIPLFQGAASATPAGTDAPARTPRSYTTWRGQMRDDGYISDPDAWVCPSHRNPGSELGFTDDGAECVSDAVSSYALNGHLLWRRDSVDDDAKRPANVIRRPAHTILIAETNTPYTNLRVSPPFIANYFGYDPGPYALRHDNRAAYSFFDGHAELIALLDTGNPDCRWHNGPDLSDDPFVPQTRDELRPHAHPDWEYLVPEAYLP